MISLNLDVNDVPPSSVPLALVYLQRDPAHVLRNHHHQAVCGEPHRMHSYTSK